MKVWEGISGGHSSGQWSRLPGAFWKGNFTGRDSFVSYLVILLVAGSHAWPCICSRWMSLKWMARQSEVSIRHLERRARACLLHLTENQSLQPQHLPVEELHTIFYFPIFFLFKSNNNNTKQLPNLNWPFRGTGGLTVSIATWHASRGFGKNSRRGSQENFKDLSNNALTSGQRELWLAEQCGRHASGSELQGSRPLCPRNTQINLHWILTEPLNLSR